MMQLTWTSMCVSLGMLTIGCTGGIVGSQDSERTTNGKVGDSNGSISASGLIGGDNAPGNAPADSYDPGQLPDRPEPGSCAIDDAAFCETFESPVAGGRAGDLDEQLWGVSRWGHDLGSWFTRNLSSTQGSYNPPATFCGSSFSGIGVGDDYVICDGEDSNGVLSGQLNEVFHDTGDFGINSMMIRQPFDFEGRTGVITLDVDAKFNPFTDGHGWWIELWITQFPEPIPYHGAPSVYSLPYNGVGFAFEGTSACNKSNWENSLTRVFVTRSGEILHEYNGYDIDSRECFDTADAVLNHMELRISQDRAEIWASDANNPSSFRQVAVVSGLDLNFTRGFVAFQHSHYNAAKASGTPTQTFRWDNIGFDGPSLPVVKAYDVPDNVSNGGNQSTWAYGLNSSQGRTISVENVDLSLATAATLNFNWMNPSRGGAYRINDGPWHEIDDAGSDSGYSIRAFSLQLDLGELQSGTNTLTIRSNGNSGGPVVGNIDLSLHY